MMLCFPKSPHGSWIFAVISISPGSNRQRAEPCTLHTVRMFKRPSPPRAGPLRRFISRVHRVKAGLRVAVRLYVVGWLCFLSASFPFSSATSTADFYHLFAFEARAEKFPAKLI